MVILYMLGKLAPQVLQSLLQSTTVIYILFDGGALSWRGLGEDGVVRAVPTELPATDQARPSPALIGLSSGGWGCTRLTWNVRNAAFTLNSRGHY